MRILLVNWAKIWDGAANGGGVNGYVQALAQEFVQRGHDVIYVSSGTAFVPGHPLKPGTTPHPGPVTVRRHPDWLGVRAFEIVNSPVLAPAGYQFRDPAGEIRSAELDAAFGQFVRALAPDVVHFHNIEGLTAGCVHAARSPGGTDRTPRIVFSLHNYHTVCPQVYLMRGHLFPCHDYDSGTRCTDCIQHTADPAAERAARSAVYLSQIGAAGPTIGEDKPAHQSVLGDLKQIWRRVTADEPAPLDHPPVAAEVPLPGSPARSADEIAVPLPVLGVDQRGQTAAILAERAEHRPPGPGDPEWEPIENTIAPQSDDPSRANDYARRRHAMIVALNACDRVLAVSDFVRDKFISLGVDRARIRTQTIGTRVNTIMRRWPELLFDPPPFDPKHPRPIRVVFMGYNNIYKGLGMFADALELLTAEYLRRFHLFIFAQAGETIEWRFRRMEPRLGGLHFGYAYQPHDLPWMLGGKDLGLVPSVWWDNAPQTVFEFLAGGLPVLGANVGGIPDFIKDNHNGLLFRGNDRCDLARKLAELARNPACLFELRKNVRPPKDIADHAAELEALYTKLAPTTLHTS